MSNKWFKAGYEEQCRGYPILEHVWGTENYPKEFQQEYHNGQIQAFLDGEAERPWFYKEKVNTLEYEQQSIEI